MRKLRIYHQVGIPYYWIIVARPEAETLTRMRWSEPGYTTLHVAQRGELVRPAPFEAIELDVGTLFGDDPR